jgi:hypothetical protein
MTKGQRNEQQQQQEQEQKQIPCGGDKQKGKCKN